MLTPNGGVFGRNPKFNNVTVENNLTVNGDFTLGDDIVINDTLLVNGQATFRGGIISIPNSAAPTSNTVLGSGAGVALTASSVDTVMVGFGAGANTTGNRNIHIGYQAGGFVSTQTEQVNVGWQAGQLSTAGSRQIHIGFRAGWRDSGLNNVAVGEQALSAPTTGSSCVAIGSQAAFLSTASDITAVGANALDANTTGTNNTAVGKDALGACTTGSSSVAIGNGALSAQTTTGSNTAVGHLAGQLCTADSSTFVGNQAGNGITTGSSNTCIGHVAGSANIGSFNTYVGSFAGDAAAASSGNSVAVGYAACFSQSSNNAALGSEAGYRRADGTVGTGCLNSVFIGQDSRPSGDSESNQIVIGYQGRGNGSNTTTIGNSSTTNTFIAGGDLRVAGGIRAVNAVNPTFNLPSGHSAAFYVPTSISTITDAVVVGNPNQSATLRMTHNGASATQCSFGRLSPSGTFDEHLRVIGTTAASAVMSVFGTTASTSTSTGALVVSGGVGVAGAIYPGDNIVMASGKGIDFSATANSSGTMTSELLSDYEEGTFTPTVSSGVTTPTYTTQLGWYTKIGRVVIAHVDIQLSGGTANANRFQFGGLPFTSFNSIGLGRSGGYWIFGGGVRANDTDALPALYMPSNSTEVQLFTQLAASYAGTSFNSITQVMRFVVIYNT